jgi:hypothetical protein
MNERVSDEYLAERIAAYESARKLPGPGKVYALELDLRDARAALRAREGLLEEARLLMVTVRDHIDELEEAWRRGAISEHDGKGGTRSNRNVTMRVELNKMLARLGATEEAARNGDAGR